MKAQASLHVCAVLPESALFAYTIEEASDRKPEIWPGHMAALAHLKDHQPHIANLFSLDGSYEDGYPRRALVRNHSFSNTVLKSNNCIVKPVLVATCIKQSTCLKSAGILS